MGQDGALAALNPAAGASTWMMLAVVGAKGGCGTSLLAANLAAELAATRSVCLVDLQFSKGDLAGCLNLAPTHCVRDVLGPDVRLDAAAVRGSVEAHSSGLDVLTQPYDLVDLIRVDAGEVDRLLGVTSQAWSVVVADCGSGIEEALLTAMRRATFVLLVVTPTIPALRDAVRTLGLLKDLGVPQSRVRLALNRWQSGLSLDQADIEEQLAMTSFVTFAEDLHACVAAEERGALLSEAAPRSRLTRDVRAAATRVLAELDQLAPSPEVPMIARLVDRVITAQQGALPLPAAPATSPDYERVKRQVHSEFVESIDLTNLRARARAELEPQMRASLTARLQARSSVLDANERALLVDEILDEILGLGPLERLIRDTSITDILINGPQTVYVEKEGLLYLTNVHFRDGPHLAHVIDRIVSAVGRRIDESSPMVDARLADGSRFNAVIPPLALDGAVVSIRRFGVIPIDVEELVTRGSMPRPMAELLRACIRSKLNILISGGTGTGKTTLLNVLSSFIPGGERIITVEDAAELRLQQPHVIRLETRPPNLEGQGEVACRDLVRNALRMRPDRIIVGEIRGAEAIDMLQAMNTGHEGSLSTIHANSPRHALRRLETLVGLGLGNIPGASIREMVGGALDVIIQVSRLADGVRRLVSITEVVGMEQGVITTQEVFRFEQRSIAPDGRVRGTFRATGVRPVFAERLAAHGAPLAPELLAFHEEV